MTTEAQTEQRPSSGEIPGSILEQGLSSSLLVERLQGQYPDQPDTALKEAVQFEHQARTLFARTQEERGKWGDAINVIVSFFDKKGITAGKDIYFLNQSLEETREKDSHNNLKERKELAELYLAYRRAFFPNLPTYKLTAGVVQPVTVA